MIILRAAYKFSNHFAGMDVHWVFACLWIKHLQTHKKLNQKRAKKKNSRKNQDTHLLYLTFTASVVCFHFYLSLCWICCCANGSFAIEKEFHYTDFINSRNRPLRHSCGFFISCETFNIKCINWKISKVFINSNILNDGIH